MARVGWRGGSDMWLVDQHRLNVAAGAFGLARWRNMLKREQLSGFAKSETVPELHVPELSCFSGGAQSTIAVPELTQRLLGWPLHSDLNIDFLCPFTLHTNSFRLKALLCED